MDKQHPFTCPICGNTDINSIGYLNGKPYCRRCISFRGESPEKVKKVPKRSSIRISYRLSKEQLSLSKKLVDNYKNGIDTLVYAVCGSGKTEIVFSLISYAISRGDKVGFAVPRRDVAMELYRRFKNVLAINKVVLVCGGHHDKLKGDLIVLTCHQLYRYKDYFDLLIMDEVDAFPFKGDKVLGEFFNKAVRKNHVLMSATPDKALLRTYSEKGRDIVRLFVRFHKKAIPVPKIVKIIEPLIYICLLINVKKFIKKPKPVLIFVPTINLAKTTYKFLAFFLKNGDYVSSESENRAQIIEDFRNGKTSFLVSTAVLERGVTIKDVQIIIFQADNSIYDSASLIQIAGRAGRKIDATDGEVLFIAKRKTEDMVLAVEEIQGYNKSLSSMLRKDKRMAD